MLAAAKFVQETRQGSVAGWAATGESYHAHLRQINRSATAVPQARGPGMLEPGPPQMSNSSENLAPTHQGNKRGRSSLTKINDASSALAGERFGVLRETSPGASLFDLSASRRRTPCADAASEL
jgi:hypothetical protein